MFSGKANEEISKWQLPEQTYSKPTLAVAKLIVKATEIADAHSSTFKNDALEKMNTLLQGELDRMVLLQSRNAGIREEEVSFLKEQQNQLQSFIGEAHCQLDALRIMVTTND